MIKWGKFKGKQRWHCPKCVHTFIWKCKGNSLLKKKSWFLKWILKKRTLEDISEESGYSISTLQRIFEKYLNNLPVHKITPNEDCILLLDGTYFEKVNCLIVYLDITKNTILHWRYTTSEKADEIEWDLRYLKSNGVNVTSTVSDGGKAILKALNAVYPDIRKQRCLVHIQRMAFAWLTKKPKTVAGKTLRALCGCVNQIKTKKDAEIWKETFLFWDNEYKEFLNEKSRSYYKKWRYTHKYLRKTRRMIAGALPDMFHYLDVPGLPKDTNKIDGGIFSDLKNHYRTHRGIPKHKRSKFFHWYLYLKNLKKLSKSNPNTNIN